MSDESPVRSSTRLAYVSAFALSLFLALTPTTAEAATLSSLTLSASSVTGGTSVQGTVRLDSTTLINMDFKLSSNNAAASLPVATVRVPAGASSATFAINTVPVPLDASATIIAVDTTSKKSASLKVLAPVPASVALSPASLTGGQSFKATVALSGPAPAGGMTLTVATSDASKVKVDDAAKFAAGQQSVVLAGQANTNAADGSITVTATAPNGAVASATLRVLATKLQSLTLASSRVTGGTVASCTATLNAPAPTGGFTATLTSSNPGVASPPASVTIAAGQSSARFDIATTSVAADTAATISATSPGGATVSTSLTVTPPPPPALVSITTRSTVFGGNRANFSLTFERALPDNAIVEFTSSNPTVVPIPSTTRFSIPGQTTAPFSVATTSVSSDTQITVTATSGGATKSVSFTVKPLTLILTLPATTVSGGTPLKGTLSLNGPREIDTVVNLSSNSGAVSIPTSLTLTPRTAESNPASVEFDLFTQSVASQTPVTLTAQAQGLAPKSVSLTITPVTLASVTLSAPGCDLARNCTNSYTGTVTLTGPAPANGLSLSLSSDRPASLAPQQTLLISSGQATGTITLALGTSPTSGPITITATAGSGSARSATFDMVKSSINVDTITLASPQGPGGVPVSGTVTVRQTVSSGSTLTQSPATEFDAPVTFSARLPSGTTANTGTFQPVSVTIPRGQSSATFTYTPPAVTADTPLELQASVRAPVIGGGIVKSLPFTATAPTIQSISLSRTSAQGGEQFSGTVQTTGPVPFSNSVTVTSSDPGAATISGPSFTSDSTSATFQVVTSPNVTAPTPVTITATLGSSTQSTSMTVDRASRLARLELPAARIFGGFPTTLTITLDGPAPAGGAAVSLSDSLRRVQFSPNPVTVPAGQSSVVVNATTASVFNPTQLSVLGFHNNVQQSVAVTVEQLSFEACQAAPQSVAGGTPISCSVSIMTQGMTAPRGGLQFAVRSSNPAALSAPASITIPEGQTSTSVQLTTGPVTTNTEVQIRFEVGSSSFAKSFTVTP